MALAILASVYEGCGNLQKAEQTLGRIQEFRGHGINIEGIIGAYAGLGQTYSNSGDQDKAAEMIRRVLGLAEKYGVPPAKGISDTMAWAHIALGNCLLGRLRVPSDQNADLFMEICSHYEAALRIRPDTTDKHQVLCAWAIALACRAKALSDKLAGDLLAQACAKYALAMEIEPDKWDVLCDYASVLADRARLQCGLEADGLYADAVAKFEAVLKINPNDAEALYNLGCTLSDQAATKSGTQANTLFAQACAKFESAVRINPGKVGALRNWAMALIERTKTTPTEAVDDLFTEAFAKLETARKIDPENANTLYNWAVALTEQAEIKAGREASDLLAQAVSKYDAALKLYPNMHEASHNLALVLMLQATGETASVAHDLLEQAKARLVSVETMSPGTGAYYLARVHARLGEENEARQLLEQLRNTSGLPSQEDLLVDPDLVSLRNRPWFKELFS